MGYIPPATVAAPASTSPLGSPDWLTIMDITGSASIIDTNVRHANITSSALLTTGASNSNAGAAFYLDPAQYFDGSAELRLIGTAIAGSSNSIGTTKTVEMGLYSDDTPQNGDGSLTNFTRVANTSFVLTGFADYDKGTSSTISFTAGYYAFGLVFPSAPSNATVVYRWELQAREVAA